MKKLGFFFFVYFGGAITQVKLKYRAIYAGLMIFNYSHLCPLLQTSLINESRVST